MLLLNVKADYCFLLLGEAVAARAQNVVRHSLFSEKTQGGGIIGVFYVTNFRVIFLTSADARVSIQLHVLPFFKHNIHSSVMKKF